MEVRRQIEVSGIVQGVGFRPYVYRLATGRHLKGTIHNTSAGVTIEIQGPAETVQDFVEHLPAEAPPLARITSLAVHDVPCHPAQICPDQDFRIVHSHEGEEVRTLISPDVAVCADCLRRVVRPQRPALSLSVHQLHQLRAALHHHPRYSVRPAQHINGNISYVPGMSRGIRKSPGPPLPRPAQRLLAVRTSSRTLG